jgi:hypothetical protein
MKLSRLIVYTVLYIRHRNNMCEFEMVIYFMEQKNIYIVYTGIYIYIYADHSGPTI